MTGKKIENRTGGDARASIEHFADRSRDPNVVGFLHHPASAPKDALILTHGAGSNCRTPLLVELAEAFADAGMLVLRCDLPYRQDSPQGPPRPGGAERDREGLRNAVAAARGLVPGRVFLGGHSYGGRQSSMLAASAPGLVDRLLLLSYPLHPPRKPEQLRVQHFPVLRTPILFVHGTRDPFGSEDELVQATKGIPARKDFLFVAGAGHELKAAKAELPLGLQVRDKFAEFLGEFN